MTADLSLDLIAAADALARGDVTSEALTAAACDRLEGTGRSLNAVVEVRREAALETARARDVDRAAGRLSGPLHGVPLAHKDLFYRAGQRSTFGSPIRADHVPDVTATALTRLDAAGAVDIGALALSEFAFSPTGFNRSLGHALNPWNPAHVAGGSSSGSAIATAARMVFGALGTDTGGSIRHPAAACGVVGLKPTWGRVSRFGAGPLSVTLDCVGPLARTARDCARLLTVIAGADAADPTCSARAVPDHAAALTGDLRGLRVGVPRHWHEPPTDPAIALLLADSLLVLRDRGAVLVEVPAPDLEPANALAQAVMSVEAAAVHRGWLATRRDDYAEVVRSRIEPGFFIPSVTYQDALRLRRRVLDTYLATAFEGVELLHLPAFAIPVPTIAETTEAAPEAIGARLGALTRFTRSLNYLGLPAISVPAGFDAAGLPVAFQLAGRPFDEAGLLRAADAYQRDTDWHARMPDV
ncbi:MAG: amidase [Paracoccaceae bacterium]